jgi:protein-tyrosine phosphatase
LVLFVCVANVCRSPTMELLTQQGLQERGLAPGWELGSAGVNASDGQRMCSAAAKAIRKEPFGEDFARRHRSHLLSAADVDRAGLILVASRHERAAVARLSAEARSRTFTMVEAALLSSAAADRGTLFEPDPSGLWLEELVALMHRNRGTLAQNPPGGLRGRMLERPRRPTSVDIRDFHNGEVRSHTPVLEGLRWASTTLVTAVGRLHGPQQ